MRSWKHSQEQPQDPDKLREILQKTHRFLSINMLLDEPTMTWILHASEQPISLSEGVINIGEQGSDGENLIALDMFLDCLIETRCQKLAYIIVNTPSVIGRTNDDKEIQRLQEILSNTDNLGAGDGFLLPENAETLNSFGNDAPCTRLITDLLPENIDDCSEEIRQQVIAIKKLGSAKTFPPGRIVTSSDPNAIVTKFAWRPPNTNDNYFYTVNQLGNFAETLISAAQHLRNLDLPDATTHIGPGSNDLETGIGDNTQDEPWSMSHLDDWQNESDEVSVESTDSLDDDLVEQPLRSMLDDVAYAWEQFGQEIRRDIQPLQEPGQDSGRKR